MMLIGLGAILEAQRYGLGTLTRMGPGFFPVALGGVMIILGILIAGSAYFSNEPDDESFLPRQPQWFAWACIICSPIVSLSSVSTADFCQQHLPAFLLLQWLTKKQRSDKRSAFPQSCLLSGSYSSPSC